MHLLEAKVTDSKLLKRALGRLKNELCDGFLIRLHNLDKLFLEETDASINAARAVLQSEGEEESRSVFYSSALNTS